MEDREATGSWGFGRQRLGRARRGGWRAALAGLVACVGAMGGRVLGQVDPEHRQLVQVGYNQPVQGKAPFAGYAFYYHNEPGFIRTNWTLRAAVAPVYADMELAFRGVGTPATDVAVGIAGGGFADSYAEIRQGRWLREESFLGHAGEANVSVYHRFNPLPAGREPASLGEVPLQGVLRGSYRKSLFERDGKTGDGFELPEDVGVASVRAGVRWGGREPLMTPDFAVELSAWYQGSWRFDSGRYGYAMDRNVEEAVHQFWGRALVGWTFTNSGRYLEVSLTTGTQLDADRLSAYRLGGTLPLAAEFPLMLPGYYFEEISARRFALLDVLWTQPVRAGWELVGFGGVAGVDYVRGLELDDDVHSGVGGGIGWTSPGGGWQVMAGYAYGIDAVRETGRGAHNIGILVQWDLERAKPPGLPDGGTVRSMVRKLNPTSWRGFNRLFQR